VTRAKTGYFLLGGLLLAAGTPAILALTNRGVSFYLLQPEVFAAQAFPYLLAAALWLPWRAPRAVRASQILARLLFVATVLLYLPMLLGLARPSGDMVAIGFMLIGLAIASSILFVTLVAFGILWLRSRGSMP